MKTSFILLTAAIGLSGCAVISIAGTAVSTAASVAGTVIGTTVDVAGAVVRGAANAVSPKKAEDR